MRLSRVFQFALLFIFICAPIPSAQAHAELVTSNPVVGSNLNALPQQVSVTFDGNLLTIGGAKTNVMTVTDSKGTQIDAKNSRVVGATLSVDVNPVSTTGEFLVSWRVVSGDGHPEQSSYRFSVNGSSTTSKPTPIATLSSTPASASKRSDFWSRYGTRLLLALGLVVAVGIWIGFERARRKSE